MTCWLCGFKTTELATNPKASTCKNGPCQICIAVANVDEEINQAVATLRRLLAKRCDLRSEQNRIHGTLIHRLPTELKNYIFELLVPIRTEWGSLVLPSRNDWGRMYSRIERPEIPYTYICRDWRDIAWSNPLLWSTIHITLGRKLPSSDPSSSINFVHDWILRSRTLPLTLHIVVENGCSEEESKGVIDAIGQCSNRWHSLSLDIPLGMLPAFIHSNIQCHLLRSLRIHVTGGWQHQPIPFSNPTMSPEKIEICGVPFRSLQISWNHLTSAKVEHFNFEELMQLFQHASQMTCCHILELCDDGQIFQIPPITHHRLKTLGFCSAQEAEMVLGSLTLPCLQEFHANEMYLLKYLPALVHRSSCPLARIKFDLIGESAPRDGEWDLFDHLQPLPGMADLVFENVANLIQTCTIKKLLLGEYFPDLRYLILQLDAFYFLWDEGVIPLLLDRKLPCLDAATKGRLRKIHVIDRCRTHPWAYRTGVFGIKEWKSYVGEQLEGLQLDINFREDGFEILIPEF